MEKLNEILKQYHENVSKESCGENSKMIERRRKRKEMDLL